MFSDSSGVKRLVSGVSVMGPCIGDYQRNGCPVPQKELHAKELLLLNDLECRKSTKSTCCSSHATVWHLHMTENVSSKIKNHKIQPTNQTSKIKNKQTNKKDEIYTQPLSVTWRLKNHSHCLFFDLNVRIFKGIYFYIRSNPSC